MNAKCLADLAVGFLKADGVDSRDPEDGACKVLVADAVGGLDGDLGFADASEALDGGPLAVVLVGVRRDSVEKLLEDGFTPDEILVTPKRNNEMRFLSDFKG